MYFVISSQRFPMDIARNSWQSPARYQTLCETWAALMTRWLGDKIVAGLERWENSHGFSGET